MQIDRNHIGTSLLVVGVVLLLWMRFAGLTRGGSDFVLPEARGEGAIAFYTFHPDEETLIRAALALDVHSPLDPPLTSYGLLPLYMARTVLLGVSSLDVDPAARQGIYARVRVLAILLSCALPVLLFALARRRLGPAAAILAAGLLACTPLAVQQAHFFTVDGVFVFFALLFFCGLQRALDVPTYARYLLVGLAIGAAAAVRLNGGLLGLVLVVGHCAGAGRFRDPKLWSAALAAIVSLLVLQPYMLWDPGRLLQGVSTDDFGHSVAIANGTVLRSWSLVDMHTVPYLHYLIELWPQAVGWPLTLAFAGGLACALWRRDRDAVPLLVWCLLYFALIGGLHTKHVRYLLPLLPFLCLFAAGLCQVLWHRHRPAGIGVAVALCICTAIYGLAFTHIYQVEDSRIQAGRFLAVEAPAGSRIGVEGGGFGMSQVVSGWRHTAVSMEIGTLFGARDYLSCGATADYIGDKVRSLHYIAAVDVNRYRQFVAVPAMFPVVSDFYRALWQGALGFAQMARFKVYPEILGVPFIDDGAEVSFLGYDHPAVRVFKRQTDEPELARRWADWRGQWMRDGRCADRLLLGVAERYRAGDWQGALAGLEEVRASHPAMRTVDFLQGAIHQQAGADDERQRALARYLSGYAEEYAYLIPWATASTLLALDLPDLALAALRYGEQLAERAADEDRARFAAFYIQAGNRAQRLGYAQHAGAIYRLAGEIQPTSQIFMLQGMAFFEQGLIEAASLAYERALVLDPDNVSARVNYGWNLYLQGRSAQAAEQFRRALALGPDGVAAFNLGLALLAQGRVEEAAVAYGRAVAEYGAAMAVRLGAVEELRQEVERGKGLGREILRRHWGEEVGQ